MQTSAIRHITNEPQTELSRCHLIVDGNAHRHDLFDSRLPQTHAPLFSEALLPQIRTTAMLIAAMRHPLHTASPANFTDEADWFAARILVLQARVFHLEGRLKPMLETANARTEAFARHHRLPFTPAAIRMSLHAGRPTNLLIMETALPVAPIDEGLVANSRRLKNLLMQSH